MKFNTLQVVLFFLTAIAFSDAVCPHQRTDLVTWSSHAGWLVSGANVTIPSGTSILLDVSPPQLGSVTVDGDLVFNNVNLNFSMEWMKVNSGGRLFIGSSDTGCAITSNIVITLCGNRTTNNVMGLDPFDNVTLGYKGIVVLTGAYVSVVGHTQGLTWTRLSKTYTNGSSSITVDDAVSWSVGDQILIVTTDYSETSLLRNMSSDINWQQGRGTPNQNEVRTITAISGKTITLDAPLRYTHWGADFEKAEVGLLNRKIIIRGDDSADQSFFGGHFMIRKVQYALIQGVQITRMGQRGLLGRYPLHIHLAKESWSAGYTFKDNSFLSNYQRCVVIHHTCGVMIDGNVAFNNTGHCYFLEDGGERGNTFNHNLGVQTYPVSASNPLQVLPTDTQPAMFWITNPNNTWTNNAAVGGRFGYWFSMPTQPTGPSALDYLANDSYVRPRLTPLGIFDNNVAHSCSRDGLHVDDMVQQGTLNIELASYSPRQGPYNVSTSIQVEAHMNNFIAYKNRAYGVWARGGPMVYNNLVSLDNMRAFNTPPSSSILQNSLLVGETDNIGTPLPAEMNRSRPDPYNNAAPIKGWETYDNSGEQYLRDTVFVNFSTNSIRPSGVFGPLECGPFLLQTRDYIRNITLINSNGAYINPCTGSAGSDCPSNWQIFDVDGSVTGQPGWIMSNTSINVDDSCTAHPEWRGYFCPAYGQRPLQLFVQYLGTYNTTNPVFVNYTATSLNRYATHATFTPLGDDGSKRYENKGSYLSNSLNFQMMANLKPRQGGYLITFNGTAPVWPNIQLNIASALPGDWIYLALHYPASYLPLNISIVRNNVFYASVQSVSSIDQVISRNQYYYDTSSSILYVRLDNTDVNYVNRWGFTGVPGSDGYALVISTAASSEVVAGIAAPPAINVTSIEDEFYADVQGCQSVNNYDPKSNTSVAVFRLNPVSYTLSYYLVHDQTKNDVKRVGLFQGAIGSVGTEVQTFTFVDNPIGWFMRLTRRAWVGLLTGNMYVNVETAKGKDTIRGQIGCKGVCRLPPVISVVDRCSAAAYGDKSIVIYSEYPFNTSQSNFTSPSAYAGGTGTLYNTTWSVNDTNSMCGSTAMTFTTFNGNFVIKTPSRLYLDTNVYKYLQFYVKLGNGNATSMLLYVNNGTSNIVNMVIPSMFIDNLYFDTLDWSRVRIPLSYLGFLSNQSIYYIGFANADTKSVPYTYYIDEVRFITEFTDTVAVNVTSKDIATYSSQSICNKIMAAPPTSQGTSTSQGTATSTASAASSASSSSGDALGDQSSPNSAVSFGCSIFFVAMMALSIVF